MTAPSDENFGQRPRRHRVPLIYSVWPGRLLWTAVLAILAWWLFSWYRSYSPAQPTGSAEPEKPPVPTAALITYSLGQLPVSVDAYEVAVGSLFPTDLLAKNSRLCRQANTEEYFRSLIASFGGQDGTVYSFRYEGPVRDNGVITAVVIPNTPNYPDLRAFKKDFGVCVAGGRYPYALSSSWLLFLEDCPRTSGSDPEPAGCTLIKNELVKSLKLVQ